MLVQALEFAVSCAVAKYVFLLTTYAPGTRFFKSALLLPLAPTVETRVSKLRFFSRRPRRHLVRAGPMPARGTEVHGSRKIRDT